MISSCHTTTTVMDVRNVKKSPIDRNKPYSFLPLPTAIIHIQGWRWSSTMQHATYAAWVVHTTFGLRPTRVLVLAGDDNLARSKNYGALERFLKILKIEENGAPPGISACDPCRASPSHTRHSSPASNSIHSFVVALKSPSNSNAIDHRPSFTLPILSIQSHHVA